METMEEAENEGEEPAETVNYSQVSRHGFA